MPLLPPVMSAILPSSLFISVSISAARYHEVSDGDLKGLVVLVEGRRSHLDQSLIWTRPRRPYLEHFVLDMQLIPGSHGPWPAEFVEAGAHDAAGGFEVTLDQPPHRDRGGVPTAGGQPAEYRVARGVRYPAFRSFGDLLENRRDRPARGAPLGPEVDHHESPDRERVLRLRGRRARG